MKTGPCAICERTVRSKYGVCRETEECRRSYWRQSAEAHRSTVPKPQPPLLGPCLGCGEKYRAKRAGGRRPEVCEKQECRLIRDRLRRHNKGKRCACQWCNVWSGKSATLNRARP